MVLEQKKTWAWFAKKLQRVNKKRGKEREKGEERRRERRRRGSEGRDTPS
jgi:hypothetical protein